MRIKCRIEVHKKEDSTQKKEYINTKERNEGQQKEYFIFLIKEHVYSSQLLKYSAPLKLQYELSVIWHEVKFWKLNNNYKKRRQKTNFKEMMLSKKKFHKIDIK